MANWYVLAKKADFQRVAEVFEVDPVIARLFRNRELLDEEEIRRYLYGTKDACYSPWLLKDMKKAVDLIRRHISEGSKIRVIGDYDIDGVCATYLLQEGLRSCHANVDSAIPHRMEDGYGISRNLIKAAKQDGCSLIITCDNGIAAIHEIAYAKECGMDVIVTDHHEVPYTLQGTGENEKRVEMIPPADAVINPKQKECTYPFSGICGAVVALKLVLALADRPTLADELQERFLPYAAMATVGDVMELRDENRIIVKEGLQRIQTAPPLGLKALMDTCGISQEMVRAYHIGFVLGPCLNASGRLDTALRALDLLQATKIEEAMVLAGDLRAMNESRKEMTKKNLEKAIAQIEESKLFHKPVLIVQLPDCHESLAGIIAGRLRERYHKPCYVITKAEEGWKGSGRSIPAYDMFEKLSECAAYLERFGGHKMAAGLSIQEKNMDAFMEEIWGRSQLSQEDFIPRIMIDMAMPMHYVTETLVRQLELLEPFGNGNSKPLFAQKNVRFIKSKRLGNKGNAMMFQVLDEDEQKQELLFFGDLELFQSYIDDTFGEGTNQLLEEGRQNPVVLTVAYYPSMNKFRGKETIQLIMQHYTV